MKAITGSKFNLMYFSDIKNCYSVKLLYGIHLKKQGHHLHLVVIGQVNKNKGQMSIKVSLCLFSINYEKTISIFRGMA